MKRPWSISQGLFILGAPGGLHTFAQGPGFPLSREYRFIQWASWENEKALEYILKGSATIAGIAYNCPEF